MDSHNTRGGHGHDFDNAGQVPKIIDETTPLIPAEAAGVTADAGVKALHADQTADGKKNTEEDDRPLPMIQIFLLSFCRMIEPIAFFSIFPFVNQMIRDTGDTAEADVGFYSGLIESFFSLTQMAMMLIWGSLADRFGRRPVLIISLIGIGAGMTAFGFAQNVWQMVVCRCFAGVFSGSLVTLRAMFSELSTPKTQARAFSLFSVAGNIGILLGPLLGGSLADPVGQYPSLFGKNDFFTRYPYSLSSISTGVFALVAALLAFFFVKETLHSKSDGPQDRPMTTKQLILHPGVAIVLAIGCYNIAIALAFTAVTPLTYFTDPQLGGYGMTPAQISIILAVGGTSQALWTLFVFPAWQRRVGTGGVLRTSYYLYPIAMCLVPAVAIALRLGVSKPVFWTLAIVAAILGSALSMTFTAVQLALNDIAPSHQTLGMLNAISLTIISGIRAVAPAAFSSLFALGVSEQILWGYFVWLILVAMTLVLIPAVRWLPAKAAGGPVVVKKIGGEDDG